MFSECPKAEINETKYFVCSIRMPRGVAFRCSYGYFGYRCVNGCGLYVSALQGSHAGALLGKIQAPCHPVTMDVIVKGLLCCFSPNGQQHIVADMLKEYVHHTG